MMNFRRPNVVWTIGLIAATSVFSQTRTVAQPGVSTGQNAVSGVLNPENPDAYGEELLRGPVHEAFAEQYNQDPIDGVVIDRAPPPPVNEIPPEIRPEGDNVEWLSGYWFWDDDRSDFLWISGTWRVIPPGQRWLPGYWAQTDGQYQWVAGSWVSAQQEAIEYIAQSPPESLDHGPAGVAPTENHFWIPGCWSWTQNDYAWRPGYWSAGYSNWVWVPQRYLWTPRGYVFCNGYWDYPIARRGTLFAPFYFSQPAYARTGFYYSPRVSILASLLQSHFWVRPRYNHYYFGDFYASNYRNVGIIPWHSYHRGVGFQSHRYSFDPLFVHASLYSRSGNGGNFYQQINNQYNLFVNQVDRRPSRTYRDQEQRGDRGRGGFDDNRSGRGPGPNSRNESLLGESIRDLVQRDPSHFTRLTSDQLTRIRSDVSSAPNLVTLRRENETSSRGREDGPRDRQSVGIGGEPSERGGRDRDVDNGDTGRDGPRGVGSLVDRLQLPPTERFGRDRQPTESTNGSRSNRPYSSARPEIGRPGVQTPGTDRPAVTRPGVDRPGTDRPGVDRPGTDRPGVDRPGTDRPGVDRPGTDRPGVDRPGVDRPGVDRPGDSIRNRALPGTRGSDDRGGRDPGRTLPGPVQPELTRPGIGAPQTRPQVGSPLSQPLRTPGYGERSSGRLGSQMQAPNETNIPAFNRGGSSGQRDNGRPSMIPNLQRPAVPPSRQPDAAPSLRTPFSGGSTPSLRSGSSVPSTRPQLTPRADSRPQFTPQIGGGSRPSAAPNVRGNQGGGDSNRGPGINLRGGRRD